MSRIENTIDVQSTRKYRKPTAKEAVKYVARGAGGTLALAGIASSIVSFSAPEQHSEALTPKESHTVYNPDYICDTPPVSMSLEGRQEAAKACIAERATKAVIVLFDVPMENGQAIGRYTGSAIAETLNGLTSPAVDVVQASQQALAEYHEKNKDCEDTYDNTNYGSEIAKNTMGLSDKYGQVIGMSSTPSCKDPYGNTAVGVTHLPDEHHQIPIDILDVPKRPLTLRDAKYWASVIAHEYGHGKLNAQHAGTMKTDQGRSLEKYTRSSASFINLDFYFGKDRTYDEYGDHSNVMGNGDSYEDTHLNSYQWEQAAWPERTLGFVETQMRTIGPTPLIIERPSSTIHQFASMELAESYKVDILGANGATKQTVSFNRLVLDPLYDKDDGILKVRIMLACDDDHRTLSLGSIDGIEYEEPVEKTIIAGQQEIHVRVSDKSFVTRLDTYGRR